MVLTPTLCLFSDGRKKSPMCMGESKVSDSTTPSGHPTRGHTDPLTIHPDRQTDTELLLHMTDFFPL